MTENYVFKNFILPETPIKTDAEWQVILEAVYTKWAERPIHKIMERETQWKCLQLD